MSRGSHSDLAKYVDELQAKGMYWFLRDDARKRTGSSDIAIEAATGPIIASTDAGVWLDRRWVEELLKPFQAESSTAVVSGFFVPDYNDILIPVVVKISGCYRIIGPEISKISCGHSKTT